MPPPMFTRPCLQRLTTSNLAYSESQHRHRHLLQTGALSLQLHKKTRAQASTKARQPKKELPRSQSASQLNLHRRSGGVTGASLPKSTLLLSTLSPPPPSGCSRLLSQVQTSLPVPPLYSTMATPSDPQSAPPAEDTTQQPQENGNQGNSSDEEFSMPLSKSYYFTRLSMRSREPNLNTSHLHHSPR